MGINYTLTKSDITYPLVDVVVGTEPIFDEKGNPVVHKEQQYLEDGKPEINLVVDEDGNLVKVPVFIDVPKVRELKEAQPDEALVPDGVAYEVLAWDEETETEADAVTLSFYIGRSVWENYLPEQRVNVLRKEIEIKFREAKASWLEGLELVKP